MYNPLYVILPPLFIIAGYTEMKSRKIPNWLTMSAIVCGIVGALLVGGWPLAQDSCMGALIGGGVFLPFCLAGVLGGGDFKLMTAVGALVGYHLIFPTMYYTVLAGGVLALLFLIWSGKLLEGLAGICKILIGRKKEKKSDGLKKVTTIPYGIAIAVGTICAILAEQQHRI